MVYEPSSPSKSQDESGQKFVDGFKILEVLGAGSFATVKKCEKDGVFYAMKVFRKLRLQQNKNYIQIAGSMVVETAWDRCLGEIEILKQINCEQVANLIAILHFEHKLYVVFELAEDGMSMEWCPVEKSYFVPNTKLLISEDTARVYVRDVLLGLEYLHRNNIAHRDIKPQNLLVHRGHCKIVDFGVASRMDANGLMLKAGTEGTHHFYPPEYCGAEVAEISVSGNNMSMNNFHGARVDIWCLGVSLHAFLFGKIPFYSDSLADLFELIYHGEHPMIPEFDTVSDDCRKFLFLLLQKEPSKRPPALDLLKLPFTAV